MTILISINYFAIKQQFLLCLSLIAWIYLFTLQWEGCVYSLNASHYNQLLCCCIYLTSTFDWKEMSCSTLQFLKECKCAYSCSCRSVIYMFERGVEKESPGDFLLCLKPGNLSSISLHDVPVCWCCGQTEPPWSVSVPCICSYLGPLEGFINKMLNSKKEGGGFFQVTQLTSCLVSISPIVVSFLFITSPFITEVRDCGHLLTENLLSLCPVARVPIGLDSILKNYPAKEKGFANLFSFSSSETLYSFSHTSLFFFSFLFSPPQRGQMRSWQQLNARE